MKKHGGNVGMPVEERQREGDSVRQRLRPLLRGEGVAFRMRSSVVFNSRVKNPTLFIIPGTQFDDADNVVFALQGGGCEVMHLSNLQTAMLVRLGLSAKAARMLVHEIRSLYEDEGRLILNK